MQINLKGIIPIPLKENLIKRQSDVWMKDLVFNATDKIKIKAPSGTGKTTLIHFLYKLRVDYEGEIQWDNKNISRICNSELAKYRQKDISIIFQDLKLFGNLTARENIELKRILPTPYYESERIDQMAEMLGVSHILNQNAGICSYGEQQRIAIIRALIQPFKMLVMDEPFSHLDMENSGKAAKLIEQECEKRQAGFILTDLDDDSHFSYTHLLNL